MGWLIVLAVVAVLVLIALIPIGVSVRYDASRESDGFGLYALIGRIPISLERLISGEKKKPKKDKSAKKTAKKAAKKADADAEKKGGSWKDFLPLIKIALQFLNSFRKKLRVRNLRMKLILAADDPCDLALNYGRAWAAVGSLMPLLERCFVIKKRNVEVECDFEATQTLVVFRLDLVIPIWALLFLMVKYGLRALKKYFEQQKMKKGGSEHE